MDSHLCSVALMMSKGLRDLDVPGFSGSIIFRGPTCQSLEADASLTRSMPASRGNPWVSVGLSTDLKA